jgi:arginine/lysine/ornithine decarboxylase
MSLKHFSDFQVTLESDTHTDTARLVGVLRDLDIGMDDTLPLCYMQHSDRYSTRTHLRLCTRAHTNM